MKKDKNIIELKPIPVSHATIYIEGDSDLVLNCMNARNTRTLVNKQNGEKTSNTDAPNPWEDIITSIHWYKPLAIDDTFKSCDKTLYSKLLKDNNPCITAFGLKKSFCDSVVRNQIDTYSTKFANAVNVLGDRGLIPITFAEASIDERLMSPKKGSPVLTRLNHFSGWKAKFDIRYTENVYSLQEIADIINYAGFGLGIGSGRSSGYGRYHIVDIK